MVQRVRSLIETISASIISNRCLQHTCHHRRGNATELIHEGKICPIGIVHYHQHVSRLLGCRRVVDCTGCHWRVAVGRRRIRHYARGAFSFRNFDTFQQCGKVREVRMPKTTKLPGCVRAHTVSVLHTAFRHFKRWLYRSIHLVHVRLRMRPFCCRASNTFNNLRTREAASKKYRKTQLCVFPSLCVQLDDVR